MKRCHRQMQRFAIYGRVKAFAHRKELSAWIESFMLEINSAYKSFAVSRPSRNLAVHGPESEQLGESRGWRSMTRFVADFEARRP